MKKLIKNSAMILAVCAALAAAFYFIAGESFRQGSVTTEMVDKKGAAAELLAGQSLKQAFVARTNTVDSITVAGKTDPRTCGDVLHFSLLVDGNTAAALSVEAKDLAYEDGNWTVVFPEPMSGLKNRLLTLVITSEKGLPGNAVTYYTGDSLNAGKFEVKADVPYPLSVSNVQTDGQLCFAVTGTEYYTMARYYWYVVGAMWLMLALYIYRTVRQIQNGQTTWAAKLVLAFRKYRFLLKQLVSRDFKTKYKRSALGVLWSFLNPLLTMLVMYIVFSTLFRSSIRNFQVYLFSGIICWNFFSEVSNMCLTSITGNASLITKVYVPKYMYPFTRAISSLINFSLSLIPLFAVILLTGTKMTAAYLLLPFGIVCLFMFALGIGLLLASLMVFFRDTQFLWGVVSTLWMYLTPIFYDVSIIPAKLMTLYKMNPLFHIIRVFRIILLDGISPEPKAYLLCFVAAVIPLMIGVWVFKKSQDRFVLYL